MIPETTLNYKIPLEHQAPKHVKILFTVTKTTDTPCTAILNL